MSHSNKFSMLRYSMPVNYDFNKDNDTLTISVMGHFNFSLVSDFRSIYTEVEKVKSIVIDLQQTDVIDSSGLGILLYLQKHYKCPKDSLSIINCNAAITKTFNMAQFKKLFTY